MKQTDYPVPARMPYIEKNGSFQHRCNWTAVAKEHVQKVKKALRKSGSDNRFDLSEPMLKRRIQAVAGFTDRIIERYKDIPGYEPERKDETGDSWIYLNFVPSTTYNQIEKHMYLLCAASIWILDEILLPDDPEKRKKLFRILPRDEHEIDEIYNIPDFWHACYDEDLIMSVMHVLYYRNRDIGPMEMDDENTPRVMMSSLHAKGEQHADVPSRKTFDALMALIPDESIRRAVSYFEELFWLWTDRYFDCLIPIDEEYRAAAASVNGIADEYNRIRLELRDALTEMKERKRKNRQAMKPAFNPLLMNPSSQGANPFDLFAPDGSPLNPGFADGPLAGLGSDEAFQKVMRMTERLDELTDRVQGEMDRFGEIDTTKRILAMDIQRLGYIQEDDCRRDYGDAVADRMKPLRIVKPFEACFALLWLIESGSDLPWLYGCGCGLMSEVAEALPWGVFGYKEWQDPIWDPDDEEYADMLRIAAEKPSTIPEWYERSFVPKDGELFAFNRSMAQVLFEETGCIMPRDIHKYDGRQKMIRKYGVPAKHTNALLLLFTALAHARRSESALNFDEQIRQYWDEEEETAGGEKADQVKTEQAPLSNEELAERLKLLQEENKKLRGALHEAEKSSREVRKELLVVRGTAELEHRELADLRELVFNLDNEAGEETGEAVDDSRFPYEVSRETVVFGGHDTWLKTIRPMLTGNIRFVDRDLVFNVNLVRNADVIWIQPNAMSHSQYYRVVDAARQHGKPVRYFTYASAAKGAMQLMEADSQ